MTTRLYGPGAEEILSGGIDFENDDIRIALVNASLYAPDFDVDDALSDIPAAAQVALSGNLSGKAVSADDSYLTQFRADAEVLSSVTGDKIHAVVMYEQSNKLLWYSDDSDSFPFTPDGTDITVTFQGGEPDVSFPGLVIDFDFANHIVGGGLFNHAARELLRGNLNLLSVALKMDFLNKAWFNISSVNRADYSIYSESTSATLASPDVTGGVFDCTDPVSGSITATIESCMVYNDDDANDYPVFYIDHDAVFPVSPSSETVTIVLSADGMFRLVPVT